MVSIDPCQFEHEITDANGTTMSTVARAWRATEKTDEERQRWWLRVTQDEEGKTVKGGNWDESGGVRDQLMSFQLVIHGLGDARICIYESESSSVSFYEFLIRNVFIFDFVLDVCKIRNFHELVLEPRRNKNCFLSRGTEGEKLPRKTRNVVLRICDSFETRVISSFRS